MIAQIPPQSLASVIQALAPFLPPENIQLYEPASPPVVPNDDTLQSLALAVVEAIRPQPTHSLRKEALRKLLSGHDTFWNQQGEGDPALRNAMGAISKALRPVFQHEKAVGRLAVPKKTKFPDGTYKGTTYVLTALGERVRDILNAEGAI